MCLRNSCATVIYYVGTDLNIYEIVIIYGVWRFDGGLAAPFLTCVDGRNALEVTIKHVFF